MRFLPVEMRLVSCKSVDYLRKFQCIVGMGYIVNIVSPGIDIQFPKTTGQTRMYELHLIFSQEDAGMIVNQLFEKLKLRLFELSQIKTSARTYLLELLY